MERDLLNNELTVLFLFMLIIEGEGGDWVGDWGLFVSLYCPGQTV